MAVVKCWRCGKDNGISQRYCAFCATLLIGPKRRRHRAEYRKMAFRVLSRLTKAFAISLILFAFLTALMISMIGVHDFVVGHELWAGRTLGLWMAAIGAVLSCSSAIALNRDPEASAPVRYIWGLGPLSTLSTRRWKGMRIGQPMGEVRISIVLVMTGIELFIVGMLLL